MEMGIHHIAAVTAALMFPAAAEAHQGEHTALGGAAAMLWHLIAQPDHALMLLGAGFAGIYLARKIRAKA
ncbi:MAG TPA: hypothetical protein DCO82_02300 [Alphaproteobacteria bacterium]|jgi:hypothetical protein|nr:hypothetical protein [Alphaproteobacteria bacterium]